MTRLALLAFAVSGCAPTVYVPAPIPSAPASAGVRVEGGVNVAGSQVTGALDVSPVEGVAVYARGLYANALDTEYGAGSYAARGAEAGVLASVPIAAGGTLDVGGFLGRDAVEAAEFRRGGACCESGYVPVEATVRRVGGHVGVMVERSGGGRRRRVGPAVRLTRASVFRDRGAGASLQDRAVFVEPAIRTEVSTPRASYRFQVGMSFEVGAGFTRHAHVPLVLGASAAVRLGRL